MDVTDDSNNEKGVKMGETFAGASRGNVSYGVGDSETKLEIGTVEKDASDSVEERAEKSIGSLVTQCVNKLTESWLQLCEVERSVEELKELETRLIKVLLESLLNAAILKNYA